MVKLIYFCGHQQSHGGCSKFLSWDLANCSEKVQSFRVFFRETFTEPIFTCGSTWIPAFERPNCIFGPSYGCYAKLLHDRMTSSRNSQIPFASTIASFMFPALNSYKHKCRMPSTTPKTLRTKGIKDRSAKTMACKAGGLLGLRDLSRTFRGSFADFRVKTLRLSGCFRKTCNPFAFEHARSLRGFPQSAQTILV